MRESANQPGADPSSHYAEFDELRSLVQELVDEADVERLRDVHDAEHRRRMEDKLRAHRRQRFRDQIGALYAIVAVT